MKVMESSQSQNDAKGWKAHSGCKDLEILKAWVLGESLGDKTALLTVEGAISAVLLGKYPSGTNNRSVLGSRHQNPCTIGVVRLQFGQSSLFPLQSVGPALGICE